MEKSHWFRIIVGVYVIPACVLLFIFFTNGSSFISILPYLLPYFVSTVAISFYIIKTNFNRRNEDVLPTLSGAVVEDQNVQNEDAPPSYLDATKDPPPYSLLKYYKTFIEWRPFKNRFTKMNQSLRYPRKVSSAMNPDGTDATKDDRPTLKRVLSSPV